MSAAVLNFLSWCTVGIPEFLMSHPIIDLLGCLVGLMVLYWLLHLLIGFGERR